MWIAAILLIAQSAGATATPRAAILPLDPAALDTDRCSALEAALSMRGYQAIDAVDAAVLRGQADATPGVPAPALLIEAKKAYREFDVAGARVRLQSARDQLCESSRILSERTLLADSHLLDGQIALAEGQADRAQDQFSQVLLLEPDRVLHPGLYPPDVLAAYAQARTELATRPHGALVIETRPEAAHVYVDGVFRGPAPLVVEHLSAGSHYVTAAVDGRGARTRPVQVRGGRSTQLILSVPAAGQIETLRELATQLQLRPDDPERLRLLLQATGADLLLVVGDRRSLAARLVGERLLLTGRERGASTGADLELLVGELVDELDAHGQLHVEASIPAHVQARNGPPTDGSGSDLGPWLWLGGGVAGIALIAGSVAVVVALLNIDPPPEPEETIDLYMGGPSF